MKDIRNKKTVNNNKGIAADQSNDPHHDAHDGRKPHTSNPAYRHTFENGGSVSDLSTPNRKRNSNLKRPAARAKARQIITPLV